MSQKNDSATFPDESEYVDLSVVIVTHNAASVVGACLESLFAECSGLSTQVLVVDSASSDHTCDFLRAKFPGVYLIESKENLGFSASNNLALPNCRGRYIALLNPDTIVHAGGLRQLLGHLDADPASGAAGPTLCLADGTVQPECARQLPRVSNLLPWLLVLDKLQYRLRYRNAQANVSTHPPAGTLLDSFNLLFWGRDQSCHVEYICGACMVMRREVVDQIGLLDDSSPMFLDDMDYCRRISDAGWRIAFVAEAKITHLWQQSSGQFRREADFYALVCHSMWLYFYKHEGRASATAFAVMVAAAGILRSAAGIVALAVAPPKTRNIWRRQLQMALGLSRWALRIEKRPPQFGFVSESRPPVNRALPVIRL